MHLLVLDATTLCSAVLFPDGVERKIIVLMAYGSLCQYLDEQLEREQALVERATREIPGARPGGSTTEVERLEERRDRLRELLGDPPQDVGLVGSREIFRDVERCVRERLKRTPTLGAKDGSAVLMATARRLLDAATDVVKIPAPLSVARAVINRTPRRGARLPGASDLGQLLTVRHASRKGHATLVTDDSRLRRLAGRANTRSLRDLLETPPWRESHPHFDLEAVDGRLLDDPNAWHDRNRK